MQIEELHNKVFARNPEIIASWIDHEMVMMSVETGKYYTLNRTAAAIWEALNNAINFNDIVLLLMQRFDVAEENCQQEVAECIETILNNKLVLEAA